MSRQVIVLGRVGAVGQVYGDPVKVGDAVEYVDVGWFSRGTQRGRVKSLLSDGTAVVVLRGGRKVTAKQTRLRLVGSSTPTEPAESMFKGINNAIAATVLPPAAVGAAVGAFAGSKYKKVGPYYGGAAGAVGAVAAAVLVTRFMNR